MTSPTFTGKLITAASDDAILAALIAENERLRSTIYTDNSATVAYATKRIAELEGTQAVLISLFREGLDVIETLVGESTEEQENLDALTEKMNNAINDVEYRHE